MNQKINLEPERVFHYFKEISQIPHGSRNMQGISDYCIAFAREHHLEYSRDAANNVVIKKEASAGYEQAPVLILQGHLDMVCVKTEGSMIDFTKDALDLQVDGDKLFAQGTSLGGDDGVAVAYALAILESNEYLHPKLEVLLTTDEEIGMCGAAQLDSDMLSGHMMLNLDSEEEGCFVTGCAGGLAVNLHFPVCLQKQSGLQYEIVLGGLLGGHSGCDIHEGRANANILAGRLLAQLAERTTFSLSAIEGGTQDNVIPSEVEMTVLLPEAEEGSFLEVLSQMERIFCAEYDRTDPAFFLHATRRADAVAEVLDEDSMKKLICMLRLAPNGVQRMVPAQMGMVQTSLNLGVLRLEGAALHFIFQLRSSVTTEKHEMRDRLLCLAECLGGVCDFGEDYPAWQYRADSRLRSLMIQIYEEQYRKAPRLEEIHAGLECGILAGKLKDFDCVSVGPNVSNIHSTEEWISISSVQRVWQFLLEVLRRMKDIAEGDTL